MFPILVIIDRIHDYSKKKHIFFQFFSFQSWSIFLWFSQILVNENNFSLIKYIININIIKHLFDWKVQNETKYSNILDFHFFVFVDIHKIRKFTNKNFSQ